MLLKTRTKDDLERPKVSIVMSIFNGQSYLNESVNSILNQTLTDFEFIIIDDGSSDNTAEIVQSFSDGRIKFIQNTKNIGLAASLNKAILMARANYIARMDADDISFPERLRAQLDFLEKNPSVDLVASRVLVFNDNDHGLIGLLPYKPSHISIVSSPWKSIPMPHPSWMGKAEWFKRYLYKSPEVVRAEDQELLLRSMGGSKFHVLPDLLLAYRQSSFNFRKTLTARVSLLKVQLSIFTQRKQYDFLLASLLFFALKLLIDCFALLPKFNWLFFARMGSKIPDGVKLEFESLIKQLASDGRAFDKT